jgi:uncharacterized protein YjbI with pentapeptide repeats
MSQCGPPGDERMTCTFTGEELTIPFARPEDRFDSFDCPRPVWEHASASRCVWHADQSEKPPEKLAATVGDGELPGARARNSDLTDVRLPEGSVLVDADLHGASLREATLPGVILVGASLTETDLVQADLSDARFRAADLTGAALSGADLTRADCAGADFTDADLRSVTLTGALLTEITLTGASLSRGTRIRSPAPRIRRDYRDELAASTVQDLIARTNHELRMAYSDNGLTGPARRAHVRERRARRKEALAAADWRGTVAWVWSLLSKVVTGYGVQLRWISTTMLVLYFASAGVYYWQGMALAESLYYSVVTFTTSPPSTPPQGIARVVAGIETFAGTAAIVLLGYVLGTRERV